MARPGRSWRCLARSAGRLRPAAIPAARRLPCVIFRPRPNSQRAGASPARPARATRGSPAPWARPPWAPPGPRRSWDRATTGWPAAAANSEPWSRSATRCWSSPGTCSPTPRPGSPTLAPTGTTGSPYPAQAPAHRRTRTALRQKGPAPRGGRRLTRPHLTRLRCVPPGAAARPAQVRFSIQLAGADTVRKRRALGHDYERHW